MKRGDGLIKFPEGQVVRCFLRSRFYPQTAGMRFDWIAMDCEPAPPEGDSEIEYLKLRIDPESTFKRILISKNGLGIYEFDNPHLKS